MRVGWKEAEKKVVVVVVMMMILMMMKEEEAHPEEVIQVSKEEKYQALGQETTSVGDCGSLL
jgi:uncharacterized membrane protein